MANNNEFMDNYIKMIADEKKNQIENNFKLKIKIPKEIQDEPIKYFKKIKKIRNELLENNYDNKYIFMKTKNKKKINNNEVDSINMSYDSAINDYIGEGNNNKEENDYKEENDIYFEFFEPSKKLLFKKNNKKNKNKNIKYSSKDQKKCQDEENYEYKDEENKKVFNEKGNNKEVFNEIGNNKEVFNEKGNNKEVFNENVNDNNSFEQKVDLDNFFKTISTKVLTSLSGINNLLKKNDKNIFKKKSQKENSLEKIKNKIEPSSLSGIDSIINNDSEIVNKNIFEKSINIKDNFQKDKNKNIKYNSKDKIIIKEDDLNLNNETKTPDLLDKIILNMNNDESRISSLSNIHNILNNQIKENNQELNLQENKYKLSDETQIITPMKSNENISLKYDKNILNIVSKSDSNIKTSLGGIDSLFKNIEYVSEGGGDYSNIKYSNSEINLESVVKNSKKLNYKNKYDKTNEKMVTNNNTNEKEIDKKSNNKKFWIEMVDKKGIHNKNLNKKYDIDDRIKYDNKLGELKFKDEVNNNLAGEESILLENYRGEINKKIMIKTRFDNKDLVGIISKIKENIDLESLNDKSIELLIKRENDDNIIIDKNRLLLLNNLVKGNNYINNGNKDYYSYLIIK